MKSNKEARLDAFFAAQEPPARDARFEAMVMNRLALRRQLEQAFDLTPFVLTGLALVWVMWPWLSRIAMRLADSMGMALPLLFTVGIVAGTFWVARELRWFEPSEAGL